jgi:hypothetical protein
VDAQDVLSVLLCELGERLVMLRELLSAPAVATKPHASAVAALLTRGLDAVEERLQRDVLARGDGRLAAADPASRPPGPATLRALDDCGRALRVLHRQLGLLDMRWSAAPVDIFLRKLRADNGAVPHPTVVLCDDYGALDDDVAERLRAGLLEAGMPVGGSWAAGTPVITLPRLEAANPLAWPLLLPALVRLHAQATDQATGARAQATGDPLPPTASATGADAPGCCAASGPRATHVSGRLPPEHVAVARLGGPAVFAAHAAHALTSAPTDVAVWPRLAPLAAAAQACAGGLEQWRAADAGRGPAGSIAFFTRAVRTRDALLGHRPPADPRPGDEDVPTEPPPPEPRLPTAAETAALLDKLIAGTPINAIDAPLPADFTARLDAVPDAAHFYDLIDPLGERPASLGAILGVGWIYKIHHSYPLFRAVLRAHDLRPALAAYHPHMTERNELLLQSIEGAYVHGIFNRGRLDR